MSSTSALQLTDQTFEAEVKKFNGVVLVDFWAPWCTPCLMMAPIIEQLATQYKDNPQVKIAQLDVDQNLQTSNEFRILSIPNFGVFVNGEHIDEVNGAVPAPKLQATLEEALKKLPKATSTAE